MKIDKADLNKMFFVISQIFSSLSVNFRESTNKSISSPSKMDENCLSPSNPEIRGGLFWGLTSEFLGRVVEIACVWLHHTAVIHKPADTAAIMMSWSLGHKELK